MADVGIVWSVSESGFEEFDRWIEKARTTSADMTIPLHRAKAHVQFMIFEEFLSEGARSGGWIPLDHDYDIWKILRGQYKMMELSPEFLHGQPGTPHDEKMVDVLLGESAWDMTDHDAVFEPDSTRAAWHQEGAFRKRGGVLPSRPVLFFLETDYSEIEEYFDDWMQEEVVD